MKSLTVFHNGNRVCAASIEQHEMVNVTVAAMNEPSSPWPTDTSCHVSRRVRAGR